MSQPGRQAGRRHIQATGQPALDTPPRDIDLGVEAGRMLAEKLGSSLSSQDIDKAVKGLSGLGVAGAIGELVPHLRGNNQANALHVVAQLTKGLNPSDAEPLHQKFFGVVSGRNVSDVSNVELSAAYLFASKSRVSMGGFRRWVHESGDESIGKAVLNSLAAIRIARPWDRSLVDGLQVNLIECLSSQMSSQDSLRKLSESMVESLGGQRREFAQHNEGEEYYRGGEFTAIAEVTSKVKDPVFRAETAGEIGVAAARSMDYSAAAGKRAVSQLLLSGREESEFPTFSDDYLLHFARLGSLNMSYPDRRVINAGARSAGIALSALSDFDLFRRQVELLVGSRVKSDDNVEGCGTAAMDLSRVGVVIALGSAGVHAKSDAKKTFVLSKMVEFIDDPSPEVRTAVESGMLSVFQDVRDGSAAEDLVDRVSAYRSHPIDDVRNLAETLLKGMSRHLRGFVDARIKKTSNAPEWVDRSTLVPNWMLSTAGRIDSITASAPTVSDDSRVFFLDRMFKRLEGTVEEFEPRHPHDRDDMFCVKRSEYAEQAYERTSLSSITHTPLVGQDIPEKVKRKRHYEIKTRSWIGETVKALESPEHVKAATLSLVGVYSQMRYPPESLKDTLKEAYGRLSRTHQEEVVRAVSSTGEEGALTAAWLIGYGGSDDVRMELLDRILAKGRSGVPRYSYVDRIKELAERMRDDGKKADAAIKIMDAVEDGEQGYRLGYAVGDVCRNMHDLEARFRVAYRLLDSLDPRHAPKDIDLLRTASGLLGNSPTAGTIAVKPEYVQKALAYVAHTDKIVREQARDVFTSMVHYTSEQEHWSHLESAAALLQHPVAEVREEAERMIRMSGHERFQDRVASLVETRKTPLVMDDERRLKFLRRVIADNLSDHTIPGVLDYCVSVAREMESDTAKREVVSMIERNPAFNTQNKVERYEGTHVIAGSRADSESLQARVKIMLTVKDEDARLDYLVGLLPKGKADDRMDMISCYFLGWAKDYAKSFSKDAAGDERKRRLLAAVEGSDLFGNRGYEASGLRMEIIQSFSSPELRIDGCCQVMAQKWRDADSPIEWACGIATRLPESQEGNAGRKRILQTLLAPQYLKQRSFNWRVMSLITSCSNEDAMLDCFRTVVDSPTRPDIRWITSEAGTLAGRLKTPGSDARRAMISGMLDRLNAIGNDAKAVAQAKIMILGTLADHDERMRQSEQLVRSANADNAGEVLTFIPVFAEGLNDGRRRGLLTMLDTTPVFQTPENAENTARTRIGLVGRLSTPEERFNQMTAMIASASEVNAIVVLEWVVKEAGKLENPERRRILAELEKSKGLRGKAIAEKVMAARTGILNLLPIEEVMQQATSLMAEWSEENNDAMLGWAHRTTMVLGDLEKAGQDTQGQQSLWDVRPEITAHYRTILAGMESPSIPITVRDTKGFVLLRERAIEHLPPEERLAKTMELVSQANPRTAEEILSWASNYVATLPEAQRAVFERTIEETAELQKPETIQASTQAKIQMLKMHPIDQQFTECLTLLRNANEFNGEIVLDYALTVSANLEDPDDSKKYQILDATIKNPTFRLDGDWKKKSDRFRNQVLMTFNNREKQAQVMEGLLDPENLSVDGVWTVARIARRIEDPARRGRISRRMEELLATGNLREELFESTLHALAQVGPLNPDLAREITQHYGYRQGHWMRIHRFAALHAGLTGIIQGTLPCRVILDRSGAVIEGIEGFDFFNEKAYGDAVRTGVVLDSQEQDRWPIKDPLWTDDAQGVHGRNVYNETMPVAGRPETYAFNFKSSGTYAGRGGTTYMWKESGYDVHRFWGGDWRNLVGMQILQALELRETYRKHRTTDPLIQEAEAKYGVREDIFYEPVAAAKPVEIPMVETNAGVGSSLKEKGAVTLVEHGKGMSVAGVQERAAKLHRMLCYRDPMPERNGELTDIFHSLRGWEKAFHYYGFVLEENPGENPTVRRISDGSLVDYKQAAQQVLFGAAARYAVINRIVHHHRKGALSTNHGTVYQSDGHNVNPLTAKDYDVIWFDEHYEQFSKAGSLTSQGSKEVTIRAYQDQDRQQAYQEIVKLSGKLNIVDEAKQAADIYYHIYGEK